MLAVVSSRMLLLQTLKQACLRLHDIRATPLTVTAFPTVRAVCTDGRHAPFLVLDLCACGAEPALEDYVTQWKGGNNAGQLVVVGSMPDTERQGRLLWELSPLSEHPLLSIAESLDVHRWAEVILQHPFATLMAQLQDRITVALNQLPTCPNQRAAIEMLGRAPQYTLVKQFLTEDVAASGHLKSRTNLFALRFQRAGQAPPSELLTAYRLLVYLAMKHDPRRTRAWTPAEIARALHCSSPRVLMTSLRERCGAVLAELDQLRTEDVVALIVDLLDPRRRHAPVKAQIRRLVADAERLRGGPTLGAEPRRDDHRCTDPAPEETARLLAQLTDLSGDPHGAAPSDVPSARHARGA